MADEIAKLNANWRVADDPPQWALQCRSGNPGERTSGWIGRKFIRDRDHLLRRIDELCGNVDPQAIEIIRSWPVGYVTWKAPADRRKRAMSRSTEPMHQPYQFLVLMSLTTLSAKALRLAIHISISSRLSVSVGPVRPRTCTRRRPERRRPCELRHRQGAEPAADLDGGGRREDESLVRLRRHAGSRECWRPKSYRIAVFRARREVKREPGCSRPVRFKRYNFLTCYETVQAAEFMALVEVAERF